MTTRVRNGSKDPSKRNGQRLFRPAPIARAIAMTLAAGGVIGAAHARQAFSPAWFAAKGAAQNTAMQTGRLPNGMPASSLANAPGQQQQHANEQLQRSINNLNQAARGIAAQQAAQEAARRAAGLAPSDVPDGLGEGGLKVDTRSLTAGWLNAKDPTQSTSGSAAPSMPKTCAETRLSSMPMRPAPRFRRRSSSASRRTFPSTS